MTCKTGFCISMNRPELGLNKCTKAAPLRLDSFNTFVAIKHKLHKELLRRLIKTSTFTMLTGFIGQELTGTPSSGSPSPTTTAPQQPPPAHTANTQSDLPSSTAYIPLQRIVSEVDAVHNTLLAGLLIAFVAASVSFGCLAIYCLRRRAQKKLQRTYQAELRGIQKKDDDERAASGA